MINLIKDERGTTPVEYGLIAAVVSLAILFGVILLGGSLVNLYNKIGNAVNNVSPS